MNGQVQNGKDWTISRKKQEKKCPDLYVNIVNAVLDADHDIGHPIIFPPSVTGSDHWYHKHFKNAMALVRVLGKPMSKVNCIEVVNELICGQPPFDRPDLLNQVFNERRMSCMK